MWGGGKGGITPQKAYSAYSDYSCTINAEDPESNCVKKQVRRMNEVLRLTQVYSEWRHGGDTTGKQQQSENQNQDHP